MSCSLSGSSAEKSKPRGFGVSPGVSPAIWFKERVPAWEGPPLVGTSVLAREEVMATISIEVDLPPDVTITAYERHGQGHGFEVAWPWPARCRCDRCHREDKAYLEFKDSVQVV